MVAALLDHCESAHEASSTTTKGQRASRAQLASERLHVARLPKDGIYARFDWVVSRGGAFISRRPEDPRTR
eukprot:6556370-Pyramimonas_sp.AAC.1